MYEKRTPRVWKDPSHDSTNAPNDEKVFTEFYMEVRSTTQPFWKMRSLHGEGVGPNLRENDCSGPERPVVHKYTKWQ